MANQLLLGRALDANGYIAPGARATIYADGTSTLITVYSDVEGTTPATNPIVADGDGFWPQRYVTENAKAVVTTSADVALYTLDPAPTSQGTGAAASAVSFAPTIELPHNNVQDAIEAAGALAVSGFAAFGLGVTGNAELMAALDATGTASGVYRFDGTTTGTYPTGVAAAETGMVEVWRQSGATAMMELHHATSNRVFRRRLTSSVWGAWRETVNVNQATAEGDIPYRGTSDFVRLAKGSGGRGMAMNAAATAPTWDAAPLVHLASKTASASATLDFTEFNNSVYSRYLFVFEDVLPATSSAAFRCRFSTDGGATYDAGATDYGFINNDVADAGGASGVSGAGQTYMEIVRGGMSNTASFGGLCAEMHMINAATASLRTKVHGTGGFVTSGSEPAALRFFGQRLAAQDTNAIRFFMSSGNITSGIIRMYGRA